MSLMLKEIAFFIVILLSNIIQGITGFAGTILAMPFSVKLVGIETAVPVLNLLGLLSGIYVFVGNYKSVDKKVLRHVVIVMGMSLLGGIFLKRLLSGKPHLLYMILGSIVLIIAVQGLVKTFFSNHKKDKEPRINPNSDKTETSLLKNALLNLLLVAAGVVHGMFVCGGPLLISYMTRKLYDKSAFRATISTVWIFLNGMLFVSHIISGAWTLPVIRSGVCSIPFLLSGMFIGGKLYSKMSQEFFIRLTYVLLLIAGISLFTK